MKRTESTEWTRENVIEALENMNGCHTAARLVDNQGNNETYADLDIYDTFYDDFTNTVQYEFLGCEKANPETIDMEVWAQMLSYSERKALENTMAEGNLYIVKLHHEVYGYMDMMIWK